MTDSPLDLVGTSDAAKILGVHPATVTRLVDSDQLKPAGQLGGGAFVFNRADVEALAEKRAADAPTPKTAAESTSRARAVFN